MPNSTLSLIQDERIINQLSDNIRVNTANKTVEIYDDFGVQLVLRNLDDKNYEAFKNKFRNC